MENSLINNTADEIVEVDPATLAASPFQVRTLTDSSSRVKARVESVRKNGLIELPVIRRVEGAYQIATGHIRIRACIILGMKKVKCIVRQISDEQMAVVVIEENLKHETLNPIEEAKGYSNLKDKFHWTEEEIAVKFGTTSDVVAQRLRLLTFEQSLQQLIADGLLSVSQGEALNMAPRAKQSDLASRVIREALTVKQITEEAKRLVEQENANKSAIENIGGIVTSVNSRLSGLERRMATSERWLVWLDLDHHHTWKHETCKHNVEGWCQRFSWGNEPIYFEQRLSGVASFKKLENGRWEIQACESVCGHCTVYEPRPSNPTLPK